MTKGEQYVLQDGTMIEVKRVAVDHAWADVKVTQPGGASWSKRQPLSGGRLPYDGVKNLSIWEGDSLPDYDDWFSFVNALDMTTTEITGWIETCKREAWVHEKVAKHEDREWNIAVARFYWRRVDVLRNYLKRLEEELDGSDA